MAELWVGIDADAGDDVSFHQLRDALNAGADSPRTVRGYGARVTIAEAVGLVTLLYGRALRKAPDGNVAAVPDGALEQWASWEGEPGIFAAAFRRYFTDAGQILTWEEVAGRLLKYREKDAERKRLERERNKLRQSGGLSADAAPDNPADAPGFVRGSSTGPPTGPLPGSHGSDSDSDRNPTSASRVVIRPSAALREAVDLAWQDCGLSSEQWEMALDAGFWRAWMRIAAEHGIGAVAFYVEDLAALLNGKHGTRVALEDALRGLDQFSTDSAKVKRQTFQNWITGAVKPDLPAQPRRGRVDPLDVAAETFTILQGSRAAHGD